MQLNPYLHFKGECETAFKFYEKCLGGKIVALLPFEGSPAGGVPPEWGKKIMHGLLQIDGQSLMGTDAPPNYYEQPKGFSVSLQINDPKEADRIFQELSQNGQIKMPIQETFWALRFAMFVDHFGIPWMVNCPKPNMQ